MLSFLSPCVLPLIPSYVTFITGMSLDEIAMARQTSRLGDSQVEIFDLDGLVKLACRERQPVVKPIARLRDVFGDEPFGRMAFVAGGDVVVRPSQPPLVLRVHDVAIDARLWIVGQIRMPFAHGEGQRAHAEQQGTLAQVRRMGDGHGHRRGPDRVATEVFLLLGFGDAQLLAVAARFGVRRGG